MAVGDLYELTLTGTFDGAIPINNVFHYVQDDGVANGAGSLALHFEDNILPQIVAPATSSIVYNRIRCVNKFDPVDWDERGLISDNVGLIGGDSLPPDAAYAFTFPRTRLDINAGSKRFVGVPEGAQNKGVIVDATRITELLALGTELIQTINLTVPLIRVFSFCIVKRIPYVPAGGTVTRYRLPANVGEFEYSVPVSYIEDRNVGTQDTRRRKKHT